MDDIQRFTPSTRVIRIEGKERAFIHPVTLVIGTDVPCFIRIEAIFRGIVNKIRGTERVKLLSVHSFPLFRFIMDRKFLNYKNTDLLQSPG